MSRVFISYRRDDQPGFAYLLKDRIEARVGRNSVFLDTAGSLYPGVDFASRIKSAISKADVIVSIIGRDWLGPGSDPGETRIFQETDFVRLEIGLALAGGKDIVPVLIEPAKMPTQSQVPPDIWPLLQKQGVTLSLRSVDIACEEVASACVLYCERAAEREAIAQGQAEDIVVSRVLEGKEPPQAMAALVKKLDFSQKPEFLMPALCDGIEIDFQLLRHCENLERIEISHSENKSLIGLRQLSKLKRIRMRRSKVIDIRDVSDLRSLEYLYAFMSRALCDVTPLNSHPSLLGVYLGHTAVLSVDAVSTCPRLEELQLSHTDVANFGPLANLNALKSLDLTNTKFNDIMTIATIKSLTHLGISNSRVNKLHGIQNLTQLSELDMRFLQIRDLSPLYALKKLKTVYIDKSQKLDRDWVQSNNVVVKTEG